MFLGHGSPMNALGGRYADVWRAMGRALPRPRAVLMVSAHWYVEGLAVTAMPRPRTIHDFYGFPEALYGLSYPAPGDPELAARVGRLLAPLDVAMDLEWGLDHGAWSVLTHVFPDAETPVVQLSIDRTQPPAFHFDIGRRLSALRDDGVLIAGSGDIVHNLRASRLAEGVPPHPWAVRFSAQARAMLERGEWRRLIDYSALGEEAALSVPTPDHYLPLLYVLGASEPGEEITFHNDEVELGAVSMTSFVVGG